MFGGQQADATATFWDDYPGARKTFATPMRRVVKHSKEAPLHTRGLLSGSTWFLLFNDAFVVSQMFGTQINLLVFTENLLENTDRDGSLLPSIYADGRSSDDVIGF